MRRGLAASLAFSSLLACGCGVDLNRHNVQGKVTLKGEPVPSGWVRLYDAANKQIAGGLIRIDGAFTVTDVPKGDYKVTVEPMAFRNLNAPVPSGTPVVPVETVKDVAIPKKYSDADKSGLSVSVPVKGNEKLEIKLD